MTKILHLGNIANNAYNNAKYLNKTGVLNHSVLNFDNPHVMACPEWEEIDTFDPIDEFSPRWDDFNVTPPSWYQYVETSLLSETGQVRQRSWLAKATIHRRKLAYWLKDQGLKKSGKRIELPVSWAGKLRVLMALPYYACLHFAHVASTKLEHRASRNEEDPTGYQLISRKLTSRLGNKDLIQAYGADVIIPYLVGAPYIAYEHGTLRELPFDGTPRAELLCNAYKNAKYTIITNPDVIDSAQRLGLENYVYIPHAVDCDRFKPTSSSLLRQQFKLQDKIVVLAPARQNWGIKGNNKYIEAFAELLSQSPNCVLFVCDWGQHRDKTKDLVKKLGLTDAVRFYSPCPKLTSVHYYQLADIVIDQLEAGCFGGITPEAMACEKPVLVKYNQPVHEWCFESHPPVINVSSADQITNALIELSNDSAKRSELGKNGRKWVQREYSITQLVERHNKLYDRVLNL